MDLVEKIYSATAREARQIGAHQLYTLVIEPNRDPRLGRNMEGYSEDPYLCSRIAERIVAGAQGDDLSRPDKVIAGLSHFPGQSQGTGGLERSPMEISERQLREVFLPPWEAGIRKAGALGVMATYPSIDGIPTHASGKLLTNILRGELGFEGMVVSEGYGFATIVHEGLAENQKAAAAMAIKAGVDVGITYEPAYMMPLIENVKEGKVSMNTVDQAVRRVLRLKFRMGLFENPYVNADEAEKNIRTPEHQELALQVAREGIVLLKNDKSLLPLKKNIRSVAVIGPNADNGRNQLGDYTSIAIPQDIVTVLDGIRNKVSPQTAVSYVKGCNVTGTGLNEIEKACRAAKKADIAIVVVGENERRAVDEKGKETGTNGEAKDIANLDLTGMQEDLIRAVHATGTPVVVVLINGRPLSTRWTAEHVPAVLEAWIPGEKGGDAIADILFGDYNPDGRLAITIPRHSGQLPAFYNYHPTRKKLNDYIAYQDMPVAPLYPFGFGLSYTGFEYKNLKIEQQSEGTQADVLISLEVQNTGKRKGSEVVQLYINDVISSVVTPYIELKGFEKVMLEPGETKTVHFTLRPDDLSLIGRDMKPVVEAGKFEVLVGSSSQDIRLQGSFVKK
jgi:beta-glucosidase